MFKNNIKAEALNTIWISGSGLSLFISYVFRLGSEQYVLWHDYFGAFFLVAVLMLLPAFAKQHFFKEESWFTSVYFILGILILLFTLTGLLAGYLNLTFISKTLIWLLGILLLVWHIFRSKEKPSVILFFSGLALFGFLTLMIYSTREFTPLFLESIISGLAHRDFLYHSSLSEIFAQTGVLSTGLHGTPFINYHWGSHVMISGLKGLIGTKAITFYGVFYSAVMIPLFMKTLFGVIDKALKARNLESHFNPLVIFTILFIFFSVNLLSITIISSVSSVVSFIFLFILIICISDYSISSNAREIPFYLMCLLLILIISVSKISTGFLTTIGVAYLLFRYSNKLNKYLWIFGGGVFLAAIMYLFVAPLERLPVEEEVQKSFLQYLDAFYSSLLIVWSGRYGFISNLFVLILVLAFILRTESIKRFRDFVNLYKLKKYVDFEIIVIITFFGILASFFVQYTSDVRYIMMAQMCLALIYLIIFFSLSIENFKSSNRVLTVFLLFLILVSMVSRPEILGNSYHYNQAIRAQMSDLEGDQMIVKEMIDDLWQKGTLDSGDRVAIYIPKTEDWYYQSQTLRAMSSTFIVPAVSGIPMISGIPDFIIESERQTYGFAYYNKFDNLPLHSVEQAIFYASSKGFSKLVKYKKNNEGDLLKNVIDL